MPWTVHIRPENHVGDFRISDYLSGDVQERVSMARCLTTDRLIMDRRIMDLLITVLMDVMDTTATTVTSQTSQSTN
jgi:hypothetical protein